MAFSGTGAGGMMPPGGMPGMPSGAMGNGMMPGGGFGMPGAMPGLFGASPMGSPAMAPPRSKSKPAAGGFQVIGLKHARAEEFASLLKYLFPNIEAVGYSQTNSLILKKTDDETLRAVKELMQKLDVPTPSNSSGALGGPLGGPIFDGSPKTR
jgi:hypothetical protein